MGRNKIKRNWTATDAEQALASWAQSGLSMSAYSKKLGLHPQRLGWWRRHLFKTGARKQYLKKSESRPLRLLPAVVKDDVRVMDTLVAVTVRLPSGITLEVNHANQIGTVWISELVHELEKA